MLLNLLLQISATDSTAAAASTSINYFSLLLKGGIVVYPILILLFVTIVLGFQRYFYIKSASEIDSGFLRSLKDSLVRGDVRAAASLARGTNKPISRVLEKGINRIGKPVKDIESAMEIQSNLEISKMEKNMGYLGLIAGVAPTLGFVGTI
jgi:biopolymer transport protein ExbB